MSSEIGKRQQIDTLIASLDNERASYVPHWRDLADNLLPRRAQFQITDTNRGERKNQKILEESGLLAVRTLSAGMMAGLTSPARPWKRLTTHDPELAEFSPVKDWLHTVDFRMSTIFAKSNLYNSFPILYKDSAVFGTSAMMIEEDFDDTIRTYVFPIGSYYIGLNDKLQVNVFAREFRLTVRQLVERFGKYTQSGSRDWSVFSTTVKNMYDRAQYDTWVDCYHVVQPNREYNPNSLKSKKYESLYFEKGMPDSMSDDGKYLRESGYDYFPVLAARWEVSGEDVYGTNCPGMEALGAIKQLYLGEKRTMQAVEKIINPPLIGPSSLRTQKVTQLPGDITWTDEREGMKGLRPLHEVTFRISEMEEKQKQKRALIDACFYKDLFLMFSGTDRREITAAEIYARQEEKLILGAVLEQLNQDIYDPLIDITFTMMMRQGLVPPPPPELQGQELKIEYISVMHQAMKMAGLSGIDRLSQYVGQIAAIYPEILDKMDFDQTVDEYAEILGTPPRIVRSDDVVAEIRTRRAQAQQAIQEQQAMQEGAKTAKDLSRATLTDDNALSRLLQQSEAGSLV